NENPYSPPDTVVQAIAQAAAEAATGLNRYPDRDFLKLRAALAAYLNSEAGLTAANGTALTAEQLWAANGSNEVMLHLFQAFGGPGHSALTFTPTYSMYPEYARNTHTEWLTVPRGPGFHIDLKTAVEEIHQKRPALVIVASPNNPTGTAVGLPEIAALAAAGLENAATPNDPVSLVVVDEAYAEFRGRDTPSALQMLPKFPNLVVTRTMSKAFGAAGLRLGYLAANPAIVRALQLVRLPYHLSGLTQAVALATLGEAETLHRQVSDIRAERQLLHSWLNGQRAANGALHTTASDANFIMFGRFANANQVWRALLEQGVLVREVGPVGWLRVSIGTPAENDAFRHAMAGILPSVQLLD
ncbi:MAG: histidinol-phosphate transaminase, partial [Promicromonosporaceae bacterium]|nr:histidinol-phosphate transaminase [Promicromonosporaceae bacterium]